MRFLPFLSLLLLGHALGTPINGTGTVQPRAGDSNWWKNAVFYQIYPRSFKDSDGNGDGDLKGIISKLDYLKSLGITAIWLSPIYPSPLKDLGYDISDYLGIHSMFGDMKDFDELSSKVKELGMRLVLDFVPNHTSDLHPWFQSALRNEDDKRNYYIWKDGKVSGPPNNWISFFHGSAWTKPDGDSQYYLHQFHKGQPDLNFRNDKVKNEIAEVLRFWMNKGVDGFRVDTIPNLVEDDTFPDEQKTGYPNCSPNDRCYLEAKYQTDQDLTFDVVYSWRTLLEQFNTANPERDTVVMMTESYSSLDKILKLYESQDADKKKGAHFSFNFRFITDVNRDKNAADIAKVIKDWIATIQDHTHNWVLGNHDQHRLVSRYGLERGDSMIMLQMFLPGVAVTYMGEEIAMENGEVTYDEGTDPQGKDGDPAQWEQNSRDFERTPFQWDESKNAGFSTGPTTWLPVGSKYKINNVARQENDPKSTLSLYKALIKLRRSSDVLLNGDLAVETTNKDNVLIGIRKNGTGVTYYMILLMNVSDTQQIVNINIPGLPSLLRVEVASTRSPRDSKSSISSKDIILDPFETLILSF